MPAWWDRLASLVGVLVPVVALMGLGYLLRRRGLIEEAGRQVLGRLVYWILLPALLLSRLSERDPRALVDAPVLIAGAALFVLGFALSMAATRRLPAAERGSVVSGVCRFNGAFVGLPVIVLLADLVPSALGTDLVPTYLVVLSVMAPISHAVAIVAILLSHHGLTLAGLGRVCLAVASNPIVWAAGAGVAFGVWWTGGLGATPAGRALEVLGDAAIAVALLATGAALDLRLVRGRPLVLATVGVARLLLFPAAGWLACRLAGVTEVQALALIVLLGCPTAVAAVPVARELGADEPLMAAIVVTSNLASPLSLLLWLLVAT